jgi:hypothetical protein
VVRANALEDNFNLYYYDQGRRQITGARVKAPALGQWHKLRVTAEGDLAEWSASHRSSGQPVYVGTDWALDEGRLDHCFR